MIRATRALAGVIVLASCGAEPLDDAASLDRAHTTATPGEVAWVRMQGGSGSQQWRRVVVPRGSSLTWVGGLDNNDYRVNAYDPNGQLVETASYPGGNEFLFYDLAVSEDESRTMAKSGDLATTFGCPSTTTGRAVQIARVERDGACRWQYAFEHDGWTKVRLADAGNGSVVVAGITRRTLDFRGTIVGEDLSDEDQAFASFVIQLDGDGDVEWHDDLGRGEIQDLATDGTGGTILVWSPRGGTHWEIQRRHAGGAEAWRRDVGTFSASEPLAIAGSPSGDVVVAGDYGGTLSVDTVTFAHSGNHRDIYMLRLDADTGLVTGSERLYGGAAYEVGGVAVDPHGNVAIAGAFWEGSLNIGGERFVGGRGQHAFVATFSPRLVTKLYARTYNTGDDLRLRAAFRDVAFTSNSRVMAAGTFDGTIDFGGEVRTGDRAAMLLRIFP